MLALRIALGLLPIIDGGDKFFNLIAYWPQYLAPQLAGVVPLDIQIVMYLLGVAEIAVGVIALWKPNIGGYLLAALMGGICFSLLLLGKHYNIVLLDIVVAIAAVTLARHSAQTAAR
jgi:hypothetical protein